MRVFVWSLGCLFLLSACVVEGECLTDEDCGGVQICSEEKTCILQCQEDLDCDIDESCINNRCENSVGCQGCPYPRAPQADSECVHGECRLIACDEGFFDADLQPQNGCECKPTADPEEVCDSVDNDCNGQIDEGCECTITNGGVEICDGIDNDCDWLIDEDLLCCPEDMVAVDGLFCIDRYEASRPDATESSAGTDESRATSRQGVLPWVNLSVQQAASACEHAEKRLCNPGEWLSACQGSEEADYCYGADYEAATCNGIDTFCEQPVFGCGLQALDDGKVVFKVVPTGVLEDCVGEYGAYDLNGNVWEWDSDPSGQARGGAYNCSNSKKLHMCTYIRKDGAEAINNVGFRCCK